ncbi:MAG: hypothetical protein ACI970_001645 [Myxococcota bacterium]|jgi:hypothetical protein
MTDHGDTVLREGQALPADERAHMATGLLASLDEARAPGGEVASAWAFEIQRRARLGSNQSADGDLRR